MTRPCSFVLVAASALSFLVASPARSEDGFQVPVEELRDHLHTVALVPAVAILVPPKGLDSLDVHIDSLVADELQLSGLRVVDRATTLRLSRAVVDSLGGLFDPRTGQSDTTKVANAYRSIRTRLAAEGADAILFWSYRSLTARFDKGLVQWDGAEDELHGRGFFKLMFGKTYAGTVGVMSLQARLEDLDGRTLYWRRGGVRATSTIKDDKFADRPLREVFADEERNHRAVQRMLEPLAKLGKER